VRVGIADNRCPLVFRTIVQKLPSAPVCLCVHGPGTCSDIWLEGLIAQAPADAQLVLLGAMAARPGQADAQRMADLEADNAETLATALAERLPGRNLLIVRSDAELPAQALPRLLCALDSAGVLAAGALDNLDPARSPLPVDCRSDAPVERIDAICFAYSRRQLIDASELSPLASAWHGQRLLERKPGLRTVLLDHCYVAASGQDLAGAPQSADPRDPLPPSPLAELRQRVAAALASAVVPGKPGLAARPVILHVLHGWGGGAERWVRDFCSAFAGANHLVLKSSGSHQRSRHGEWLELHDGSLSGPPLRRLALPCAIADTAISDPGYRLLFAELLAEHAVDAIIVSSLIGHSLDVLRSGLPTVRIVHDHYPLWPVLHRNFSDADLRFDDAQREADLAALGRDREFANIDARHWKALRDSSVASMLEARVQLVAPSQSALDNDLRLAPELAALPSAIIPHGLSAWPGDVARARTPPVRSKLRLVFPGRVRRGKGAELLEKVLPRLSEMAEVFLLGAGADAHAFFGMDGVHILLDYRREDLPGLLADLAADAAVLLPTVAETFGYTLSELRDLGMPVIATRLGAYAERIEDGVDGFLVEADAESVVARITELSAQRQSLRGVRDHLGARREPDLAVMAEAYARVLALPSVAAMRYPMTSIDAASQLVAARSDELARTRQQIDSLALQLRQTQAENARRGDWGHALDRQLASSRTQVEGLESELEKRTAWAQRLDAEVETLRPYQPAYETVIASRSWRLTAPLRNSATRLRHLRAALAFRKHRLIAQLRRVRGSLVQHGLAGTWARLLRELGGSRPDHHREVVAEPSDEFSPFALPTSAKPQVSIIIPVHNKFAYTAACLRSLAQHADAIPFEVIVVDDLSSDTTPSRLGEIDGIRRIRNAENLGFVGSCNAGAAIANGEFVLFLNNDTVVTAGWLAALLRCFEEESEAGLVGARLVYPDGRLQEAGGIIFNDGSGWNYGRFEDPEDTRFAFRREADYCSGAAIMLRRSLFESLGCFDTRYSPAYYEDTDLAFAVRAAGYKVFYEPRSRVVHFEGISAGTDTGSGMKRYQVINHEKFVDKWRDALSRQPAPGTPIHLAASHRAKRRILIIDAVTPMIDQDAGSLRMVNLMRILRGNGCHVVFMPSNLAWVARYTADLQALGIEVLHQPFNHPSAVFRERGAEFDAILLSRHYVACEYLGLARLYARQARLIFDTVDLHYLRELRAAQLEESEDLARLSAKTRVQEIGVMREADVTLVVSHVEREILADDAPGVSVDVLSTVHEIFGCRRPFADRRDLLFVGSFQHPPNSDAVLWFVKDILPRVLQAIPDVRLHVIGSKVTDAIRALASEHVVIHGFVEDIAPAMDAARISIAPLRYGAGVKGKINMAMSYGLPVVATSMAVEGMHVQTNEEVLVADGADAYADAIVRLYNDETLWKRLSAGGLGNVRAHFSFEAAEKAIHRIFGF
jgi:O-antigen biosynthesis protein